MENPVFQLTAIELRLKTRVPVRIGVPPPLFRKGDRISRYQPRIPQASAVGVHQGSVFRIGKETASKAVAANPA